MEAWYLPVLSCHKRSLRPDRSGLSCAYAPPSQASAVECVDDGVVTARMKAAILDHPTQKVTEINVETFKGVAHLSGFVRSQAAANWAVEVARKVSGVKSVKNEMRIK